MDLYSALQLCRALSLLYPRAATNLLLTALPGLTEQWLAAQQCQRVAVKMSGISHGRRGQTRCSRAVNV